MQSLVVPAPRVVRSSLERVSERDARILRLALRKLKGDASDFSESVRALHEAVAEIIPSGRVYLMGRNTRGPIIGSLITGVGICASDLGIAVVRVRDHHTSMLGRFESA